MMRSWPLFCGALWLTAALSSSAAQSSVALAQELGRSRQVSGRIVSAWWLPLEYWLAMAEDRKKTAEEREAIGKLLRNYLIIAILDAKFGADGKLDPATHAQIGPKLEIRRNGERVELLHDIDPRVARHIAELSYVLEASLALLRPALRIFFLPNIDDGGQPLLHGASTGQLLIRYAQDPESEPLEFRWRAPLTALAGSTRCPEGGEPLEAHWSYCPWHGVKAR